MTLANPSAHQTTAGQSLPSLFWDKTFHDPIATFTFFLVVATIVLGIATILLWLTTKRLAKETRQSGETQAEKMERSAAAMEGVAASMAINASQVVRSVAFQGQFGQMQLRPYLTVLVGEGIYQDDRLRFQVSPKLLNTGHTPARDVRWRIAIDVLPVTHLARGLPVFASGGNSGRQHDCTSPRLPAQRSASSSRP